MIYTPDGRRIRPTAGFVPQWITDKQDSEAYAHAVSGTVSPSDSYDDEYFLQEKNKMDNNNGKADFGQGASGEIAGFKKVMDEKGKSSPADASINSANNWNDVCKDDKKNGQRCA